MLDLNVKLLDAAIRNFNHLQSYQEAHQQIGISQQHWDLISRPQVWTPAERPMAREALRVLIDGVLPHAGMTPMLPVTHYVAVIITGCVNPVNWMMAASSVVTYWPTTILANALEGGPESLPASQDALWLCILASDQVRQDMELPFKNEIRGKTNEEA